MRCTLCEELCPEHRGGFCGGRRCIATHLPLEVRMAARWLTQDHDLLRRARGMTGQQVRRLSIRLQRKFAHRFDQNTIQVFALDNPYMTEDARRVMVSEAVRARGG